MFYMRTLWFHDNNDDPSIIYSELDQNRYEIRKIEFLNLVTTYMLPKKRKQNHVF